MILAGSVSHVVFCRRPVFVTGLFLLFGTSGDVFVVVVCCPVCGVRDFKVCDGFLVRLFSYTTVGVGAGF